MSAKERDFMALFKSELAKSMPQKSKVMLFGSRARGDERAGSDWDVLILLDKQRIEYSDFATLAYPLQEVGWQHDEEVSPVLYTKQDWQNHKFTPFYQNVETDGVVLWEC